jgi:hypothetical protein
MAPEIYGLSWVAVGFCALSSGFRGALEGRIFVRIIPSPETLVETHGPLGTLWAGLALGFFFVALTWLNLLLGHVLTPLFLIPATWLMDAMKRKKTAA